MAKFTLSINMGNDAMRSLTDVADELMAIGAHMLCDQSIEWDKAQGIYDGNGNKVGTFKFHRR